ncbi:MAG TPA: hypothetical protein VHP83_07315, partial [Aggregatilineaceae bacterium]|nr:hypothetical protein [Aggregatilineaceae bacterium]
RQILPSNAKSAGGDHSEDQQTQQKSGSTSSALPPRNTLSCDLLNALQLRRDAGDNQVANARLGLALSLGGLGSTAVAHIFERVE